jgi:hypothetical protein
LFMGVIPGSIFYNTCRIATQKGFVYFNKIL